MTDIQPATTTTTIEMIQALHIELEGFTAFFRLPYQISGYQLTLPCPSYSTILGLLSACTDKTIRPSDTRIGFEFKHSSADEELERTDRFQLEHGRLKKHYEGQGLLYRYIHFRPHLDLYLTNLDFKYYFNNPTSSIALGRSQDLCWVKKVEEVTLTPIKSGNLGSTMISNRFLETHVSLEAVPCPEWFDNDVYGQPRTVGNIGFFHIISPDNPKRTKITMTHLYHPSNMQDPEDAIYLHEWSPPLVRIPSRKKEGKEN